MLSKPQPRGYYCRKCKINEPAGHKFAQCSVCKKARYCSKECQTVDWPSHRVFTGSKLIFKADCANMKADRKKDGNPHLTRKFDKWHASNYDNTSFLSMSVLHPISRIRLEEYVAVIRMMELPNGLRVISVEASSIDSLPEEQKNVFLKDIITLSVKQSKTVNCLAVYEVEAIGAATGSSVYKCYILDADGISIQKVASHANDIQAEIIKQLNKEV
jgi:hypothetical protein